MCGISGAVAAEANELLPAVVGRLTAGLQHRGPDGEAFWADVSPAARLSRGELPEAARVVLGHRRLSIVDLVTGDQPMSNEDGSVWITFNGEIYNHAALRRVLTAAGHRFATQADTEVLLHGWEEWGERVLGRLNGIFAFALHDARQNVTLLARDPAGVKPLYVGSKDGFTWWASELGAARAAGVSGNTLSPDALKLFLLFRYVPAPATILTGVVKLPPGHYALLAPGNAGALPDLRPYASAIRSSAEPRSQAEWREALISALDGAVARQLMSDVPVGSLLSGGVDSTLITHLMRAHLSYRPQAFGVGFGSHGKQNEALLAERAAAVLDVPFTGTSVSDDEYRMAWPDAFARASEPIGNSGGLLFYLLCRSVARTHKVVLSGQGADEPLGGYPRHTAERVRRIARLAPRASGWVAERLLGAGAGRRLARVARAMNRIDRYLEIFTVWEPALVDRWVTAGAPARELGRGAIARWTNEVSGDDLNDLLRVDARMSLADDLLAVADQCSMRASVEVRVPFLDLEFLELAERMPSRYKVSRLGERKWLYREAARSRLPRALRGSTGLRARLGRKLGFTTPLARWFGGGGTLGTAGQWSEPLVARGLMAKPAVDGFLRDVVQDPGAWQRELLALYALSQWTKAAC